MSQASATTHPAIFAAINALTEAVAIGGAAGVPGGHLFAPLMGKLTLAQFEKLMALAVALGKVTKRGQVYYATRD